MDETGAPHPVQALAAGSRNDKKTPTRRDGVSSQTPPTSRRTRSQAAPDWTVQETLILISEIAAVDGDWRRALSSYQKWKMISDNCMDLDVNRSLNQCKRRWESLLADYRKIRDWESQSGAGSYWSLDGERRKQFDLPDSFIEEVFGSMDAVIKTQEDRSGSGGSGDSDSEDLITTTEVEMLDVDDFDSDFSGPEDQTRNKTGKEDANEAREMANKLQENAEQVHAILRGELANDANGSRALVDLTKPNSIETEFTRRQADQLIKAFGDLVGTLNQFTALVKDGGCEDIRPTDSLAL